MKSLHIHKVMQGVPVCVLACLIIIAHATPTFAQSTSAQIPRVKVIGDRIFSDRSYGGATTVIDADTIRKHRYRDFNEILSSVPGVHVSAAGGRAGQTSVFMRGAESDHVLLLIDGVRVNDPSSGNVPVFVNIRPENIERVVVTRGPQSARYGSAALGGVINIITKKGGADSKIQARAEAASHNNRAGAVSFGGAYENVDYFMGVDYRRSDGASLTPKRLRGDRDAEDDSWRNLNVNTRVAWTSDAYGRLELSYGVAENDNEYDALVGQSFESSGYRQESNEQRFGVNYALPRIGVVEPFANFAHYRRLWRDKQPGEVTRYRGERYVYELGGDFTFGDKANLRVGYENRLDTAVSNASFGAVRDMTRTQAAFAALEYDWSDTLVFNAALRSDDPEEHDAEIGEQYGIHWALPAWDADVRINYATAFKTPTAIERVFSNANLETETARGWNVNVDKQLGKCHLSATYFYLKTRDLIEYNFATMSLENIGRATAEGVETSAACHLRETLIINADYGVTRALKKGDNGNERLARRPLRHAGVNMIWDALSLLAAPMTVAARLDYTGPRADIARDTFTDVRHGGYVLAHLNMNYAINPEVDLYVRVANLFDKSYEPVDGYAGDGFGLHVGVSTSW